MLRLLLPRLLLLAIPFAAYWLWREQARRSGQPMGSTPWGWLVGAGGVLLAVSLIATVVWHEDNRRETYVPGEASPDGHVSPGHFTRVQPQR
jgi:hypothetical protein